MARKEFSKKIKRQAAERSKDKCEAFGKLYGLEKGEYCNVDLSKGSEYDHIVRASDGGSNELENCARVCIKCHKHKTTKFDTPQAAKTKRMSDKKLGINRSKPKIQNRGFTSSSKRKTNPTTALPPKRIYG